MNTIRATTPERLGEELAKLTNAIEESADQALNLPRMHALAQAGCPVASGALRDSIRVIRPSTTSALLAAGGLEYINPVTGRPVTYARAVHDGSSRQAPRPFLEQAVMAEKHRVAKEIALGSVTRL